MNKCIFIGNLGRDNELTYTSSGKAICKNSIAVTERWKTSDGEKREKTTWVRFTIWGKRGEIFNQYTGKGSKVCLEGRLQIDKVDKNGIDVYYTSLTVDDFEFLSRRGDSASSGVGAALPDASAGAAAAGFAPVQSAAALPTDGDWGNSADAPEDLSFGDGSAALPEASSVTSDAATLPEVTAESAGGLTDVAVADPAPDLVPEEDLPW